MIGQQPTGAVDSAIISAVSHEGLSVMFNGRPARLAIITDDGQVVASGDRVAREVEAVAVNAYRGFLKGKGFLRVMSNPITPN